MKRADIPTAEVLAAIPLAGSGTFDVAAYADERGWPVKVLDSWVAQQAAAGTIDYGVSPRYVWRCS
jgi:hypothetical protein